MTLTFDLLTWISIGIIYACRTIYLRSLKLLEQSVLELSVAQGLGDWHDLWPTDLNTNNVSIGIIYSCRTIYLPSLKLLEHLAFLSYQLHKVWETDMTFDLDLWPTDLNINRDHLLIKDYLPIKFEASWAKRSWVISCTSLRDSDLTFELDLWPTDLNINRDHLLIKNYLPTKFEASGPKRSWVISCTRLRDTDIPTDMCNAICLLLRRGGINMCVSNDIFKYIRVGSRNFLLLFLRSHGQTVFFFN